MIEAHALPAKRPLHIGKVHRRFIAALTFICGLALGFFLGLQSSSGVTRNLYSRKKATSFAGERAEEQAGLLQFMLDAGLATSEDVGQTNLEQRPATNEASKASVAEGCGKGNEDGASDKTVLEDKGGKEREEHASGESVSTERPYRELSAEMHSIAQLLRGDVDAPPGAHPFSDVWHEMDDEELFERALQTGMGSPQKWDVSSKRKLAFLFLVRGDLPLAPFWWRFFRGYRRKYSIYIHAKPGYEYTRTLPRPFRRRQIPSQDVGWGKMSMVDAEKRLLANALLDPLNDRFVLVSESCIPLHNFTFIYNYFMLTNKSFINSKDDPGPWGRGRYKQAFMPLVSLKQWRKGSQWFEFTREVALSIVSDQKYYKKFKDYCKGSCYNDEHYFPTYLYITRPQDLAFRSTMYVDWSRGGWHPTAFEAVEVNEKLIGGMRKNKTCVWNDDRNAYCFLFARKFMPSAVPKLLHLAPMMGI